MSTLVKSAKAILPHRNRCNRRDFLKGISSTALAAGLVGTSATEAFAAKPKPLKPDALPGELLPPPRISAAPGSEGFWNQIRKAFPLPADYIHMNTGTTGSQPWFSLNNLAVYNLYKSIDPRDWQINLAADYPDLFPSSPSPLAARQTAVAAAYGADPTEIVLSYNTTDACNLIFAGIPWQAGDRIITTTFEHPALAGPIAWARDYHGVAVEWLDTLSISPLPSPNRRYCPGSRRRSGEAGALINTWLSRKFSIRTACACRSKKSVNWRKVTGLILSSIVLMGGDIFPLTVINTEPTSSPARATNGSVAGQAPAFSMSENRATVFRLSLSVISFPMAICSGRLRLITTTVTGPRRPACNHAAKPILRRCMR